MLVESCRKSLSLNNSRNSSINILHEVEEEEEEEENVGKDNLKEDVYGSRTTIDVLFEE